MIMIPKPTDTSKFITLDFVAEFVHDSNRRLCLMAGEEDPLSWFQLPEELKEGTIDGIKYVLDNPTITPEELHNKWVKERLEAGWVCGRYKDQIKKTHPNLRPYSELSRSQKLKDILFINTILTLKEGME